MSEWDSLAEIQSILLTFTGTRNNEERNDLPEEDPDVRLIWR